MRRFRTLRSSTPMRRRPAELTEADWFAVYRLVDARALGQCEYHSTSDHPADLLREIRCPRQAREHHHVVKPRRSHHDPDLVVALCRPHHERCAWPYQRGRLVVTPLGGGAFTFAIVTASDKWSAR